MKALCKRIYSPVTLSTPSILHGRMHESSAIEKFEKKTEKKVRPAGLFVSPILPFLGASPDGVIEGQEGEEIVEVKCPYSAKDCKIVPGDIPCLEMSDNIITLKKEHIYYHQVQGQLGITNAKHCYFVVYTFKDIFVQKIPFDAQFFHGVMVPKLKHFYENYYRPYVASQF